MLVDKTGISCTQTSALDEDNVHVSTVTQINTIFRKMRISKIQVFVFPLKKKTTPSTCTLLAVPKHCCQVP